MHIVMHVRMHEQNSPFDLDFAAEWQSICGTVPLCRSTCTNILNVLACRGLETQVLSSPLPYSQGGNLQIRYLIQREGGGEVKHHRDVQSCGGDAGRDDW